MGHCVFTCTITLKQKCICNITCHSVLLIICTEKMILKKNYKKFEICAKICKPLYIRQIHYINPKKYNFCKLISKIRKGQLRRKRLKANRGTWHRLPSLKNDEFGRYDTMRTYPTTTDSLHAERVSPAHPSAQGEWKPDWVNNYGRTYGKVEIQNKNYAN